MNNQIKGYIKQIGQTLQVSDKFKRRELIITDYDANPQYPQHISLQLSQDKCSMADGLQVGQIVVAHINIRGREWTSPQGEVKYFNTLEVWKIEAEGYRPPVAQGGSDNWAGEDAAARPSSAATAAVKAEPDDLPF